MYILHESNGIVAIATRNSKNRKTGPSIQIWILDSEMHPHESRQSGHDAEKQCKGCPFASYNGCYVATHTLTAIWKAYQNGRYQWLYKQDYDKFFQGKYVRFGAYGNPSMLPIDLIERIANLAHKHTGYFHDWHSMPSQRAQDYGRFLMASVDSDWDAIYAAQLGLRYFRTIPTESEAPEEGLECPATTKGLTCAQCGLCDGLHHGDHRPDIWIRVHGYQSKKANLATSVAG